MPASETVTIGSGSYPSYASVAQGDDYENASIGDNADSWRASDTDTKGRGLVSSTRMIDAYPWGDAVTSDTAWQAAIVPASIELAASLINGDFAAKKAQATDPTKRLKAGSVELEYFWPGVSKTIPTFPPEFLALMGPWFTFAGTSLSSGSLSFGTCRPTTFDDCNSYDVSNGI